MKMKVKVGEKITPFTVETITGNSQTVPDPSQKYTHLQFRRFSGCPICNFHLHTFSKSVGDLEAAGIKEVIMFHSSVEEMLKYQDNLPFATVADPKKKFYKQFGVETSWLASLHPKALWAGINGILIGKMGLKMENGAFGLPADILLDHMGKVIDVKYGTHADDQWEVSELLEKAS
jgi:peroxiredoxin